MILCQSDPNCLGSCVKIKLQNTTQQRNHLAFMSIILLTRRQGELQYYKIMLKRTLKNSLEISPHLQLNQQMLLLPKRVLIFFQCQLNSIQRLILCLYLILLSGLVLVKGGGCCWGSFSCLCAIRRFLPMSCVLQSVLVVFLFFNAFSFIYQKKYIFLVLAISN